MKTPAWLREANPADLAERVQRLPLERLATGQQTLRAYRRSLIAMTLSTLLSFCVIAAALITHPVLPARAGTAGLIIITAVFPLCWTAFGMTIIINGWREAQQDESSISLLLCRILSRFWVVGTAATFTFVSAAALIIMTMMGSVFSPDDPLNDFESTLIMLPLVQALFSGQLYRGLIGLLKGTPRAPRTRKARPPLTRVAGTPTST